MPRKPSPDMVEARIRIISEVSARSRTGKDAASVLGVTVRAVRTWVARYRQLGEAGLAPGKPGPKGGAPWNRTSDAVERAVCALAAAKPLAAPSELARDLRESGAADLDQSTVFRILRRLGVRYRDPREYLRKRQRLYALDEPGREVQADACFPFGRSRPEAQYDALDDCSRWAFSALHTEQCVLSSMEFIDNVIRSSPFRIKAVRTDRGSEFDAGFTRFLSSRGIRHVRNPAYTPQRNGKVERYHRTLWAGMGEIPRDMPAREYRYRLALFPHWYNFRKPHGGLGMGGLTPAERLAEHILLRTPEMA